MEERFSLGFLKANIGSKGKQIFLGYDIFCLELVRKSLSC